MTKESMSLKSSCWRTTRSGELGAFLLFLRLRPRLLDKPPLPFHHELGEPPCSEAVYPIVAGAMHKPQGKLTAVTVYLARMFGGRIP